ncbi:hypothetical protein GCM10008967_00710 [Bacillus carboniphilus]|uniref:Uncharacterized protein n=1 Tax=Bacillus carboniphilus TaxID=86663 RepID=A0ABN0VPK1_9BACI
MTAVMVILFLISFLLFGATVYYSMILKKSRMYPPKTIIRKKIQTLGTFAVASLLLGIILLYIPAG